MDKWVRRTNRTRKACLCGCGRREHDDWRRPMEDGSEHPDKGYALRCGVARWHKRFLAQLEDNHEHAR